MRYAILALAAVALALWESRPKRTAQPAREPEPPVTEEELDNGVTVTRVGGRIVRIRGGMEQVLGVLNPARQQEEPPPLPEGLDVGSLKKYYGGCPHCGERSLYGENLWRYRVLSRTRERWDNTTTYLARCKKCSGLMKATVDHNE